MKLINILRMMSIGILQLSAMTAFAQSSATLYQAGTLASLNNGVYKGSTTLRTLYKHGNFGLGTTNGPEGEMVLVNRQAYVGDMDGNAHAVGPEVATPYAVVFEFKPTITLKFKNIQSLKELTDKITAKLPSNNLFYAVKVNTTFESLRMRNWTKPTEGIEAVPWILKTQRIKEYQNIKGTLLMVKAPTYSYPITLAGYHVHFISDGNKKLGHVYNVKFAEAEVQIQPFYNINIVLPDTNYFLRANLKDISTDAVQQMEVEKPQNQQK